MRHPILLGLLALVLGAAGQAGDVTAGARIVVHGTATGALPCMACHGAGLRGNAAIGAPALAGLPVATTLAALDAIATGRVGHNYVMKNNAVALRPAERRAVADYLATLKPGG